MSKKERVILIKGDSSQWYEQAIFIVNQNAPQSNIPIDFVAEAEKIINNHVRGKYAKQAGSIGIAYSAPAQPNHYAKNAANREKREKIKKLDFLNALMIAGCIVLAGVLLWGLFAA